MNNETEVHARSGAFEEGKEGRAALLVVSLALMTDMLLYGIAVPVLPAIAASLGSSSASIGALFAAYAASMLALMPLVGFWVDRAGARGPLLLGLIGLAIATALFAFAPSYAFLVAARVLQGASAAVSWTAGLALLAASFPAERRNAAMGKTMAAMSAGTLLGPPLGGLLFERGGRAAPFLLGAAVAAMDAAARLLLLKKAAVEGPREKASALVRAPGMGLCLAMAALGAAVVAALEPVLPQVASSLYGSSPTVIGSLFAAATLATVVVYPLAGKASDRFLPHRVAALGAAIAALSLGGLTLASSVPSIGSCLVGAATGSAFILVPTVGLIAKAAESRNPPAYGSAYSLYNIAYAVGLTSGPLISGALYGAAGLQLLALAGAGTMGLGAIILARIHPFLRRRGGRDC